MTLRLIITPNPSDDMLYNALFILWYIWKARNDHRFQKRRWTSFQIHHAAKAHMLTHLEALQGHQDVMQLQSSGLHDSSTGTNYVHAGTCNQANHGSHHSPASQSLHNQLVAVTRQSDQGMNIFNAGQNPQEAQHQTWSMDLTDRFLIPYPTTLQGIRCYIDASILPDQPSAVPRDAGIGIFIVNMQVQPPHSIFIKAAMRDSCSVIMAEAAAMALAAEVTSALQMQQVTNSFRQQAAGSVP